MLIVLKFCDALGTKKRSSSSPQKQKNCIISREYVKWDVNTSNQFCKDCILLTRLNWNVLTCSFVHSGSSPIETQDSGLGLSQQSSPPDVCDQNESVAEPKCGCCFERPVDSIFLHGDVGHQIYCYKCSQRVWKERKRCPCCNRLSKVVKVYRGPLIGGEYSIFSSLIFQ